MGTRVGLDDANDGTSDGVLDVVGKNDVVIEGWDDVDGAVLVDGAKLGSFDPAGVGNALAAS